MSAPEEKFSILETVREGVYERTHTDEQFDPRKTLGFAHAVWIYPVEHLAAFHPPGFMKPFLTVAWLAMGGPISQRRRERRAAERAARPE